MRTDLKLAAIALGILAFCSATLAAEATFTVKPMATRDGDKVTIRFAVSAATARFADPQPRMLPVGVTFLVPERLAR